MIYTTIAASKLNVLSVCLEYDTLISLSSVDTSNLFLSLDLILFEQEQHLSHSALQTRIQQQIDMSL